MKTGDHPREKRLHSLSVVNVSVLNQVLGCNLHQGLVKKKKSISWRNVRWTLLVGLHFSLRFIQSQASSSIGVYPPVTPQLPLPNLCINNLKVFFQRPTLTWVLASNLQGIAYGPSSPTNHGQKRYTSKVLPSSLNHQSLASSLNSLPLEF